MRKALLVVDIQNDFLAGGALAVPHGNEVIAPINQLLTLPFDAIVATQDFHPPHHCSFASRWQKKSGECVDVQGITQLLWPDLCVQGSLGAKLHSDLHESNINYRVYKGQDPEVDSYSAFSDNKHQGCTGLEIYLKEKNIDTLYITGLATNFCVLYSVRDALRLGFRVIVVIDACKGIDTAQGTVEEAVDEMKLSGASITTVSEILQNWMAT